jgi:hypothetical protein
MYREFFDEETGTLFFCHQLIHRVIQISGSVADGVPLLFIVKVIYFVY